MNDHLFDKIIKEKADGHEAPVPSDAWRNIGKHKQKRRRFFWWTFCALLLSGFLLFGIYKYNGPGISGSLTATNSYTPGPTEDKGQQHTPVVTAENTPPAKENHHTVNSNSEKNIHTQKTSKINDGRKNAENLANTNKVKNNIGFKNNKSIYPENKQSPALSGSANINDKIPNRIINAVTDAKRKVYSKNETVRRYKKTSDKNKLHVNITPGTLTEDQLAEDNTLITLSIIPKGKKINGQANEENLADSLMKIKQLIVNKADSNVTATYASVSKKEKAPKLPNLVVDFSISPFIAITGSNRLIGLHRTTATPLQVATFSASVIRITTEPSFSYTLALRKKIAARTWIGTGLQYSIIKENVHLSGKETHTSISHLQRLDVSNGTAVLIDDTVSVTSSGTRTINAVNSYRFISIPVSVQYELYKKNNWALLLAGSLSFNINSSYSNSISGSLTKQYSSGNTPGQNGHKLSADFYTGIRIARNFSKYALFVEPSLQYNLIKYDIPGALSNNRLHRAGIAVGISWQPGKIN